jgi:hypothetical protein
VPYRLSSSGPLDRPRDRGWERDQDGLAALAADLEHPVAVFFAEVIDVRPACFEDPQAHAGHLDIVRELIDGATGYHPEK